MKRRCECMGDAPGHREWALRPQTLMAKSHGFFAPKESNSMKYMPSLMCFYIVCPPEISFWNSHEYLGKEQRKPLVLVTFTRETEPTGCIYQQTRKGIYDKESSHAVMEAEEPHDLQCGSWRPQKANGLVPGQTLSGLRPKKS